ncbi:GAF sensor signal transduction histidine kinase [Tolypothrix sp. NIES-4075]|uniref:GAF domain-containing sensor histidine kinase n=1 Tax=Tolypothrix sp. NIES-4075 TaxID=2005459 RepID=UPI000B5C8D72|nr:GAF domain-containing sensor histidine kinase [Tolypothrix sp. NIES-4075]GAX43089.1 GAF sensor signal transduction histidine kinase [Tolypothrix sp. NIES-4075]
MLSSPDLSFSRILPIDVFNQLGELLQQMQFEAPRSAALVLTEAVLARIMSKSEWQKQKFTLVVSEQFSALLVGNQEENVGMCVAGSFPDLNKVSLPQRENQIEREFIPLTPDATLYASLTFNSQAIASFISQLKDLFAHDSHTYQHLERYLQIPSLNDATLQGKFTLLLLEYLLPLQNQFFTASDTNFNHVSVCQPIEDALRKQIYQERLLNQVTTQIRKSQDLQVIMATAIAQVREFLELDRLVIYKFDESRVETRLIASVQQSTLAQSKTQSQQNWQQYRGCIVYEARATDAIPSVLNYQEKNCFVPPFECWEKYRQGFTLAVDDVEKTYVLSECLLNFLRRSKVRAKLAAPIIYEDKLWGLLIANQCHDSHHWTESEINLLTSIAEQLAIAIYQSELMRSLTEEKQTLEHRVIERTMALREALVAAEAANRLKSEFLATISHELLTPLTYVIGMSSTLLRWPLGELSQRQRDYLQTIHDSGEHLLEMINDILDLSQIEAGKAVLNISEFSLTNIAQRTVESLQEKAISQQIQFKLDLQIAPQRDRFTADVSRLEQILWNLSSNAIKFTPEGGSVILRLWVEDDNAIFQVEDTGIGIPEEQLPLLFEKFQQLDTPYRRRYEGTGVGLALTKQLIELHRGRIEVESTVAIGSIFTVWIPQQPMSVVS